MSVIVIGGGPHPQARIVVISELDSTSQTYEIREGDEILGKSQSLSRAKALLPLIQSGE